MIETKKCESAKQARTGRQLTPIGEVSELYEQIEDALRHRPVESAVKAKLGASVVGHK